MTIAVPPDVWEALRRHLFQDDAEQVAFLFARDARGDGERLAVVDSLLVAPERFDHRSAYHVALADDVRPEVIKRAWDTGTCVVEAHSHVAPWASAFSPTDLAGLRELVPHLWWRLRGRPYAALVLTATAFDALAWVAGPDAPESVAGLEVGADVLRPTGRTLARLREAAANAE